MKDKKNYAPDSFLDADLTHFPVSNLCTYKILKLFKQNVNTGCQACPGLTH